MTIVVVNDASCLIDLRKGGLLQVLLRLPHRFVVPLPIRGSELLTFTPEDWRGLDAAGLETFDLPGERVAEALAFRGRYPRLSANDCFCLVTTQCHEAGVLLTGDRTLRNVATSASVRVHGVLWAVDELRDHGVCEPSLLVTALKAWRDDLTVFLPAEEIELRLKQLQRRSR